MTQGPAQVNGSAGTAAPFGRGVLGWLRGIWERLTPLTTTITSQVAVGTSQVAVPAANLANRVTITVEALAANGANVYIGLTGVSATTGHELAPGASIDLDLADSVDLFAVSDSGTQRVSTIEVA